MKRTPDERPPVSYIALNSELVEMLWATLKATQLELIKVQQMGRPHEPMTIKHATSYLCVSRKPLHTYCEQGAINPCEYGRRVWILRSELDRFLSNHKRR